MSVFVEILRIKQHRETRAESEKLIARLALDQALTAEERAQRELVEYRGYSERRERELYADLCRRLVRLRDIEDVQWSVSDLRAGERAREEARDGAVKQREEAAQAATRKQEVHLAAKRVVEKFVELARSYDEERVQELQRLEDMEMEEVRGIQSDREEREEWELAHHE